MSYRRNRESGVFNSGWRIDHRDLLAECGIPEEIANDDRRWTYVLLHGDDAVCSGWSTAWITPAQANRLLYELAKGIENDVGVYLIRELRKRASLI